MLSRGSGGGEDEEGLDVCNGANGGPHDPWQTQEGEEHDEATHNQHIQMVSTTPLLLMQWKRVQNDHTSITVISMKLHCLSIFLHLKMFTCKKILKIFGPQNIFCTNEQCTKFYKMQKIFARVSFSHIMRTKIFQHHKILRLQYLLHLHHKSR